jgi:hypothetical protein
MGEQEEKQMAGQLPIGMRSDGTLNTIEPGAPIPQPSIITAQGDVMTPEEAAEAAAIEDDAELRSEYEAAGGDAVEDGE